MSYKPENPPAFPENFFHKVGEEEIGECKSGATLRDYFAAHAPITMQDAVTALGSGKKDANYRDLFRTMSQMRFNYADAMLEAREARESNNG